MCYVNAHLQRVMVVLPLQEWRILKVQAKVRTDHFAPVENAIVSLSCRRYPRVDVSSLQLHLS